MPEVRESGPPILSTYHFLQAIISYNNIVPITLFYKKTNSTLELREMGQPNLSVVLSPSKLKCRWRRVDALTLRFLFNT